jgi:hypothetical protein
VAAAVERTSLEAPLWIGADSVLVRLYDWLQIARRGWLQEAVDLYLLAGMPVDQIASELGIECELLTAYENYFFDVRTHLDRPSAIAHIVIGHPEEKEPLSRALERERRRMAFFGGPSIARELVNDLTGVQLESRTPADMKAILAEMMKQGLLVKLALVVRTLPLDKPRQTIKVLKQWIKRRKAEQRRLNQRRAHDELNGWGAKDAQDSPQWREAIKAVQDWLESSATQLADLQAKAAQAKGRP